MSAKQKNGMAALEEWLQQEYVNFYDNATKSDERNEVTFLNRMFDFNLLLKDGSRDYIINEGKIYYLLDKSCKYIPKEIKEGLVGGDTAEYSEYTRLHDVYGITKDLKVYYCNDGVEGVYGSFENYDVDPNELASGVNGNQNLKNALTGVLKEKYGVEVDEKGVTLGNIEILKDLEIDGEKYSGITDVTGLGDLKTLKTLTLTNLNLDSLKGLDGMPNLYYLYLKNTTVKDYKALSSCLNLQYLYIYMPSKMIEETANKQIELLGEGLKEAEKLAKLNYFGISRRYIYV